MTRRRPRRKRQLSATAIFLTVVVLTCSALVLHVALALAGGQSDELRSAAEVTATTYKMGFGAIVALMGRSDR